MSPLPSVTTPIPGRLTYVNDAQDRRLPFGSRIRIDGDAALPYRPLQDQRPVGPDVADYESAVSAFAGATP